MPDGLDEARQGAVEAHAADCAACRDEIAMVLAPNPGAVAPAVAAPDAGRLYADVRARIRAAEELAPTRRAPTATPRRSWRGQSVRSALAAGLATLALGGALGVALGATLFGRAEPVYRTASEAPAPTAAGPALEIVFRDDATAADIHQALRATGATMSSGPTPLGVYRVSLSAGADALVSRGVLRSFDRLAGAPEVPAGLRARVRAEIGRAHV